MSSFMPLSSLPSGLGLPPGGGWSGGQAAAGGALGGNAATAFGFNGSNEAARVLSVPSASGDGAARLEARFLDCLLTRV